AWPETWIVLPPVEVTTCVQPLVGASPGGFRKCVGMVGVSRVGGVGGSRTRRRRLRRPAGPLGERCPARRRGGTGRKRGGVIVCVRNDLARDSDVCPDGRIGASPSSVRISRRYLRRKH